MKKQTKRILYASIIVVLALIFIIPRLSKSDEASGRPGGGGPGGAGGPGGGRNMPLNANGFIVTTENISNNISSVGTALANEEVEIRSEISGKVVKIHFREGASVRKGNLLVKINDNELQAQLAKAKYRQKLLSDREFRQRELFQREAISQEQYDAALNELNVTKADVDLINAQIEKTEIRAPFDGTIGLKNISEGSFVSPTVVITSLQNISQIKIDFSVPEKYSGQVKIGDIIKFKPANSSEEFTAKVYAMEPKVSTGTRTLQIRGIYANSRNIVVPGSFVDVKLVLSELKDVIMIPSYALTADIKSEFVFVYKGGKAKQTNVKTGVRTENSIQIKEGINKGDTLITSGILQLKNGMKVKLAGINN